MGAPRDSPRPGPLYALVDGDALDFLGRGPAVVVEAAAAIAQAGVSWIQLRLKRGEDRARFKAAEGASKALEGTPARLWIDDRADLATLVGASGVHVGQQDLPPQLARRVVGPRCWIGLSCHDQEQIRQAEKDDEVDVVAYGPVFATRSKADPDPVVGLEGMRRARRSTRKPLVAIGGIDAERLPAVLAAGADTVAVLGALCRDASGPLEIERRAARLLSVAARG